MKQQTEVRKNDILLGSLERPALQWLAAHMPAWVNSDTLTVIGILGSLLTLVSFIIVGRTGGPLRNYWVLIACLGFVINWFGDSLDGTLARYRHLSRPNYGYYTDHAIDGITSLLIFAGIGLSGIARFDVAMVALCGWLLLMVQVYLKTHATGVFEMTSIKLGPTELRLIVIILNTVLFYFGAGGTLFEVTLATQVISVNAGTLVLAFFALLFLLYYIYQLIRTGSQLAYEDGEALKKRQLEEQSGVKLSKAEKKAAKKRANAVQDSSGITA